jgi:hypothetical protein
MNKVIFKVVEEQSPVTIGMKTKDRPIQRKRYIPVLYSGELGCSFCGSTKPKDEAKEDDGKISLICPDCQMDV